MSADFRNDPVFQSTLQDLELQRKRVRSAKFRAYAVTGLGALVIIGGIVLGPIPLWGYITGAAILIAGIVLNTLTTPAFNTYRNAFKQKVVGAALRTINESLVIDPESGMSEEEFIDSQLFTKTPDRYSSEDQISGKAGKTSFCFSEVRAEYKTVTTDNKGRRRETWHEILKGIVFTADFNKNFQGVTVVRPRDIGSAIGAWISKAVPVFFSKESTPVELENIAFNKTFITHATDQIEARYILTPGMMDKLCQLNEKCSYTMSLSFIQSSVYIAFPLKENYFEPPLFKSILDPSCLERDLLIIKFLYDIIEELDLNTRIWGKS